jgi:hypothetical protein
MDFDPIPWGRKKILTHSRSNVAEKLPWIPSIDRSLGKQTRSLHPKIKRESKAKLPWMD